jgi:hypothetical protein
LANSRAASNSRVRAKSNFALKRQNGCGKSCSVVLEKCKQAERMLGTRTMTRIKGSLSDRDFTAKKRKLEAAGTEIIPDSVVKVELKKNEESDEDFCGWDIGEENDVNDLGNNAWVGHEDLRGELDSSDMEAMTRTTTTTITSTTTKGPIPKRKRSNAGYLDSSGLEAMGYEQKRTTVKRKRGRPRKNPTQNSEKNSENNVGNGVVKRKRGRPRKHPPKIDNVGDVDGDWSFDLDDSSFKRGRGRPRKIRNHSESDGNLDSDAWDMPDQGEFEDDENPDFDKENVKRELQDSSDIVVSKVSPKKEVQDGDLENEGEEEGGNRNSDSDFGGSDSDPDYGKEHSAKKKKKKKRLDSEFDRSESELTSPTKKKRRRRKNKDLDLDSDFSGSESELTSPTKKKKKRQKKNSLDSDFDGESPTKRKVGRPRKHSYKTDECPVCQCQVFNLSFLPAAKPTGLRVVQVVVVVVVVGGGGKHTFFCSKLS